VLLFEMRVVAPYRHDDGHSKHIWNVGQYLRDCTAQHLRRQTF
jgi:hypothetical protein